MTIEPHINTDNIITQGVYIGQKTPVSKIITERVIRGGDRFFANSNISEHIREGEIEQLVDELTEKFEGVLDSLVIDRHNDPNSMDTGRRMAKMYVYELMAGRYEKAPKVTAFPNDDAENRFGGMLIATAELKSVCSHHHQTVSAKCWIGIIPSTRVIGLSKYTRLAQWHARRGTLQEELTKDIADDIKKHTGSQDVAVVIQGVHGCCTNRGIMAHDSSTWTSVLHGQFHNNSVRQEFYSLIQGNMSRFNCT